MRHEMRCITMAEIRNLNNNTTLKWVIIDWREAFIGRMGIFSYIRFHFWPKFCDNIFSLEFIAFYFSVSDVKAETQRSLRFNECKRFLHSYFHIQWRFYHIFSIISWNSETNFNDFMLNNINSLVIFGIDCQFGSKLGMISLRFRKGFQKPWNRFKRPSHRKIVVSKVERLTMIVKHHTCEVQNIQNAPPGRSFGRLKFSFNVNILWVYLYPFEMIFSSPHSNTALRTTS